MAMCASCYAPASVLYEGRGKYEHRAITACQWDAPAAERWAAGAGPVTTTPVAATTDTTAHTPATLF